jgi:hypothetical protein
MPPYSVTPDGKIQCDTADEALSLQEKVLRRIQKNGHAVATAPQPQNRKQDAPALPDLGRRFLTELLAHPRQTTGDIAKKLEVSTYAFPPMYRGVARWAEGAGIDYATLISRTKTADGEFLSINESVREAVEVAMR